MMIELIKSQTTKDYMLLGIDLEDLEIIQEGLHRLFNESNKNRHRDFRTKVLQIDRAIDPELKKYYDRT